LVVLDKVMDLCPFPATALRIIALTSKTDVNASEVVEALACDPAMTVEVLRVANSAGYARSRKIDDLQQAVMTVGLAGLRNLATAIGMMGAFRSKEEASLELHATSVLSGAIAANLMVRIDKSLKSSAFLCGLLCEVGALTCLAVDGPRYMKLWNCALLSGPHWSLSGIERREDMEKERYGATSREIGACLMRRYLLPEDLALAVESGGTLVPPGPLPRVTIFARVATPLVVDGFRNEIDTSAELREIGVRSGITEVDPDDLLEICRVAAEAAERSLRKTRSKATS
jgi:HD-like signal output (HDOD) protein